jgi:hypothetical protein
MNRVLIPNGEVICMSLSISHKSFLLLSSDSPTVLIWPFHFLAQTFRSAVVMYISTYSSMHDYTYRLDSRASPSMSASSLTSHSTTSYQRLQTLAFSCLMPSLHYLSHHFSRSSSSSECDSRLKQTNSAASSRHPQPLLSEYLLPSCGATS